MGYITPHLAAPVANIAVVALAGYGLWQNRHLRSLWLAAFGLALNTVVIWANGGQMPVSAGALKAAGLEDFLRFMENSSDAVHSLINNGTKLWFLGDVIPLPWFKKVISPGDALIIAALILFFPEATRYEMRKKEKANE